MDARVLTVTYTVDGRERFYLSFLPTGQFVAPESEADERQCRLQWMKAIRRELKRQELT